MNLLQTIETADFRNLKWGLIPSEAYRFKHENLLGFQMDYEYWENITHWIDYLTPADTQTLSSCESNSFCLYVETMYNYMSGQRVQLDYDQVYEHVCNMWHNRRDEGSMMGEAWRASKALGMIPQNSATAIMEPNIRSLMRGLKHGPVQVGVSINEGYRPANLAPGNNCIDHSYPAVRGNGHAMLVVGSTVDDGARLLILANSWGARSKLLCITPELLFETLLDSPRQYLFPEDFASFEIPPRFVTARL